MDWNPITQKPKCDTKPGSLGVLVIVWINESGNKDGGYPRTCYYGRRINDEGSFYKYGATVHGVTHWMYLPKAPRL